jgi:hypothetical protein
LVALSSADNEGRQRISLAEQAGSEVKSVELERLVAEGFSLTECRNAFEAMRDVSRPNTTASKPAPHGFPRTGSKISHRAFFSDRPPEISMLAPRSMTASSISAGVISTATSIPSER